MGDKVPAGPLTYNVVEKVWRSQLGEGFQMRMPENRFLLITVSATNGSGSEVSVPLLQLEGAGRESLPRSRERRRRGRLVRHVAHARSVADPTGSYSFRCAAQYLSPAACPMAIPRRHILPMCRSLCRSTTIRPRRRSGQAVARETAGPDSRLLLRPRGSGKTGDREIRAAPVRGRPGAWPRATNFFPARRFTGASASADTTSPKPRTRPAIRRAA